MSLSISKRLFNVFEGYRKSRTPLQLSSGSLRGGRGPAAWAASRESQFGITDCYGATDIGLVREKNEDQYLIADLKKGSAICHSISDCALEQRHQESLAKRALSQANLLLVADGVGGHAGGERASQLAVEGIAEYLQIQKARLSSCDTVSGVEIREILAEALAYAQQFIQHEADESSEHARMGTTVTLAYLIGCSAYIAHVGDSRAYLCREGEIFQITHDQTIAQMLADSGAIDRQLVPIHPFRNVLGSLLCRNPDQMWPNVFRRRLLPGDRLLLCTDGLTKHVRPYKIAKIIESAGNSADACRELIATANAAGGTDNITVVLAHFGPDVVKDRAAPLYKDVTTDSDSHVTVV